MEKRVEALVLIDFARYKKDLYKTKKKLEAFSDFLFSRYDEHMECSLIDHAGETIAYEEFPEELKDDLHGIVINAIEGISKEIDQAERIIQNYRADEASEVLNAYNKARIRSEKINRKGGLV